MCLLESNQTFAHTHLMSQYLALSPWLGDFDSCLVELVQIKELFFCQTVLLEHLRDVLESSSETIKYAYCLATVASEFNIANRFWPEEVKFG